ncbi:hypothetical protein HNQ51_002024 [Inhella inkyongensis]|uniref:DUF308 domain-containing protein n=1 Tax=Inhella inkyongensis TaxID=392593 RepID=A0A840S8E9_9BURK|nr:hypothetical protein [Inhella inkyongensis]MBB5204710.1 hypothetical protein [Inhella inkyongensis]
MSAHLVSLDQQLQAFKNRRFLAMPLAGTLAWALILVAGQVLAPRWHLLTTYLLTGCIAYLGMGLSKLTGEDFMAKENRGNRFSVLFMLCMGQALLAFAIAIPFAIIEPRSAVFMVGMLAGFMWLPITGLIGHWIGAAHAIGRTVMILAAWFLVPDQGMVVVPLIVLGWYALTIPVLERRWAQIQRQQPRADAASSSLMAA